MITYAPKTLKPLARASFAALVAWALLAAPASAGGFLAPGGDEEVLPSQPSAQRKAIRSLARTEMKRNVRERRGDNVPRYKGGRGKIAPYSISAAWCAAFSTWIWSKVGITDYLSADHIWPAYGGVRVAVQVKALRDWAKANDRWTYKATPGDLVVYGDRHIGIVTKANRSQKATYSIEGNASDRVRRVKIDWSKVTGYISPTALVASQRVARHSPLADIE